MNLDTPHATCRTSRPLDHFSNIMLSIATAYFKQACGYMYYPEALDVGTLASKSGKDERGFSITHYYYP